MSSGKGCETRMNTEARVFQSQSESIAEMGCSATLNRQVVGSIPTASTNQNQQLEGGATTVAITSRLLDYDLCSEVSSSFSPHGPTAVQEWHPKGGENGHRDPCA